MTIEQDKDDLLDALYEMTVTSGQRPCIAEAGVLRFPDWSNNRLSAATEALRSAGEIMNPSGGMMYVDLTSTGRKRANARASPPPQQTVTIGANFNSPIQQIASGGKGIQNVSYETNKADLEKIVELYRQHVEELHLDAAARRRADAQIATIEAQLQDKPDPTIIKAAGKSLKTIIEAAIGGALGNVAANPAVWVPLLAWLERIL